MYASKLHLPRRDEILKAINHPIARSEVLHLRGSEAARFGSAIHHVGQRFLPDYTTAQFLQNLYSI